jgi:hypothetical protein
VARSSGLSQAGPQAHIGKSVSVAASLPLTHSGLFRAWFTYQHGVYEAFAARTDSLLTSKSIALVAKLSVPDAQRSSSPVGLEPGDLVDRISYHARNSAGYFAWPAGTWLSGPQATFDGTERLLSPVKQHCLGVRSRQTALMSPGHC